MRGVCWRLGLTLGILPVHWLSAQELVQNPGFEEPGSPAPPGWFQDLKQTGKEGTVSLDSMRVHSGRAALKLEPNERNSAGHPLAITQIIPGGPYRGKRLTFSAFLRAEGGATAAVGMMSAIGKRISNLVIISQTPGSPDWVQQRNYYDVPDNPKVQLILTCFVTGRSGAAWFDDVSVALASDGAAAVVGAPPATPRQASQTAMKATLDLDAARIVRDIPRTLYGTNVEWIWNGNFMWDDSLRAVNPDFVKLVQAMGVSLIRYPGGHYSDYYHWKDGTGPFDRRPQILHEPGKPDRSRSELGTDEMLSFARQVNGELLLTVNAGSGTAQEAADWVRYVKDKVPPVRYWEIGNELYINDASPMSKATTLSPQAYADRFVEFARAMRAANPNIQIGAIGGVNQGRYSFVNYPDWDRVVLERARSQIDFLAVHDAYAPGLFSGDQQDVRTVYRGMFGVPTLIGRNLEQVARTIRDFAPDRADHIKIAVTEWGPLFAYDPRSRFVDHPKTLGSAVFAASVLKTFIESAQTEIANFFLLNDVTVMGWIGSRDAGFPPKPRWTPTARYYAFQMFTRHFGDRLIWSNSSSPTFDTEPVGLWDGTTGVPYLDVLASLGNNGRLYILGINKSFDTPVQTKIRMQGYDPAPEASTWTLAGNSVDANTGTVPIRLPGLAWAKQAEDASGHFSEGGQVEMSSEIFDHVAKEFTYTFPPLSVTSIEIRNENEPLKASR